MYDNKILTNFKINALLNNYYCKYQLGIQQNNPIWQLYSQWKRRLLLWNWNEINRAL